MSTSRKIAEKDIKKLWGRAAGRCSFCEDELAPYLDIKTPDVIGEMAHIIGFKQDAARGLAEREFDNSYENLILLCPTCHTKVDAAPQVYTVEKLYEAKSRWESKVSVALQVPLFDTIGDLCDSILRILIENRSIWSQYGPESDVAIKNPLSNMSLYWNLRKIDTIVPNNNKICSIIDANKKLIPISMYEQCVLFKEHAKMFERNCYVVLDSTPRFPIGFEEEVKRNV